MMRSIGAAAAAIADGVLRRHLERRVRHSFVGEGRWVFLGAFIWTSEEGRDQAN